MISFNLFKRRRTPDLYCAVPEDLAVPAFIAAERWEFDGKADRAKSPRGFKPDVAASAARINGFYMFQRT